MQTPRNQHHHPIHPHHALLPLPLPPKLPHKLYRLLNRPDHCHLRPRIRPLPRLRQLLLHLHLPHILRIGINTHQIRTIPTLRKRRIRTEDRMRDRRIAIRRIQLLPQHPMQRRRQHVRIARLLIEDQHPLLGVGENRSIYLLSKPRPHHLDALERVAPVDVPGDALALRVPARLAPSAPPHLPQAALDLVGDGAEEGGGLFDGHGLEPGGGEGDGEAGVRMLEVPGKAEGDGGVGDLGVDGYGFQLCWRGGVFGALGDDGHCFGLLWDGEARHAWLYDACFVPGDFFDSPS